MPWCGAWLACTGHGTPRCWPRRRCARVFAMWTRAWCRSPRQAAAGGRAAPCAGQLAGIPQTQACQSGRACAGRIADRAIDPDPQRAKAGAVGPPAPPANARRLDAGRHALHGAVVRTTGACSKGRRTGGPGIASAAAGQPCTGCGPGLAGRTARRAADAQTAQAALFAPACDARGGRRHDDARSALGAATANPLTQSAGRRRLKTPSAEPDRCRWPRTHVSSNSPADRELALPARTPGCAHVRASTSRAA